MLVMKVIAVRTWGVSGNGQDDTCSCEDLDVSGEGDVSCEYLGVCVVRVNVESECW